MQKFGGRRILVWGSGCAAAGLALAIAIPYWPAAFIGFGLVGLGASNIVPVLFSALGRQQAMPANLAVAAVTTLGYSGILEGPALIGLAAQATNLSTALLGVAAILMIITVSSRIAAQP